MKRKSVHNKINKSIKKERKKERTIISANSKNLV